MGPGISIFRDQVTVGLCMYKCLGIQLLMQNIGSNASTSLLLETPERSQGLDHLLVGTVGYVSEKRNFWNSFFLSSTRCVMHKIYGSFLGKRSPFLSI